MLDAAAILIAASHMRAVFDGARRGLFAFGQVRPGSSAKEPASPNARWLVVVCDDYTSSLGPTAFHQASLARLARRATHASVYSGAGDPQIYDLFACAAAIGGRVLVVETQLRHHCAWLAFVAEHAPRAALIEIQPPAEGCA